MVCLSGPGKHSLLQDESPSCVCGLCFSPCEAPATGHLSPAGIAYPGTGKCSGKNILVCFLASKIIRNLIEM